MRKTVFLALVGLVLSHAVVAQERYEANWESLKKYEVPEWFRDIKFGIFIHWGPYAVPAFENEWYGHNMYREFKTDKKGNVVRNSSKVYKHHKKKYGDPGKFGYKDFIPDFNGKNFNAAAWMDLFEEAGAKYVVPVGEHCDGFAMYNSKHTRWNAVNMGPKRDIVGELFAEARKRGIKTGVSSHFAYGWNWWHYKKGYDTTDPKYSDFYGTPHDANDPSTPEYMDTWYYRAMDMVDTYDPDLLWFDFGICKPEWQNHLKKLTAAYYNKAIDNGKEVVLNYKNISYRPIPDGAAVLDVESGKLDRIRELPWQTDMSMGQSRWGWTVPWATTPPNELIIDLVDVVSKNGCLLLNVAPDAGGNISDDQVACLKEIGAWLKVNGEGIYKTRPFTVFGQGPTNASMVLHGNLKGQNDFKTGDIRYTQKGQNIYAFLLKWPENQTIRLKAFDPEMHIVQEKVTAVEIMGHKKPLKYRISEEGLIIELPKQNPVKHVAGIKIVLEQAPSDIF
ncbi:alpha-L-fucosidase [Fulvivirgaceae bacterium BMA12]|uniref:alpha-L-fucosidase n=1 Tax=Agaribacillus aureus TaxID=3051825 RepID=A0ABT8L5V8_9BACT|nr:alpha-L-fucosidase [Fulvivirgaceae bacterium BMA12]